MKSIMFMFASSVSASTTIEINNENFHLADGGVINKASGELEIPHGVGYAETVKMFERPLEVSVMMKQDNTKQQNEWAECGVLQMFPQEQSRHTGYNAGTNWWHKYFGAGVDGSISNAGSMSTDGKNMQYDWNEVKIKALQDGKVEFYFNGELRKTVTDHKHQKGYIRMGFGCRHYRFKNLVVNSLAKTSNHGIQMIPIDGKNWLAQNGGTISNGEIYVTGGWASVTSQSTFTAPLKVSVMMKQDKNAVAGNHPECGVIQVFPQQHSRHSGYNAGTNWWGHYFGAGTDGGIGQRGNMYAHGKNMGLEWNKVSIDVNEDGYVYYYFNDILRHTEGQSTYKHGTIRMGLGCRNYHFKDVTVEKPLPTQTFTKELMMNTENFKLQSGAKFIGDVLNVRNGNGFVETYQSFQRPFTVSVKMKQDESIDWNHQNHPECGVMQVFPQQDTRHTGYNAGTNWWATSFGTGVDGDIGARGSMNGRTLEWNTVQISVLENRVEYYLNGNLRYTAHDTKYHEGKIRVGYGCRTFHFKDFMITTDQPTQTCDPNNCAEWSCAQWCECYDESKVEVYETHEECQDTGDDDACICK